MNSRILPRVLAGPGLLDRRPLTYAQHETNFASSFRTTNLLQELEKSGLTGRGGAAFPTYRKAQLIADQHSRVKYVVVNAMEGEPAAHKDHTLLATNPHLVLDGAAALATAVGARLVSVCIPREAAATINHVERAIHERQRRSNTGPKFEVQTPPGRYVAGEESALVHWLDDNETLPQFRVVRPHVLRIGRHPVLVDNAETHAHIGLIQRYGGDWFRDLGTADATGSTLVSVSGAIRNPAVLEVALGTPLHHILETAGADTSPQAILLGGYGGTWLHGDHVNTPYDNASLAKFGASVGAGVIMVLPKQGCGITETLRITKWMANESARQCGPCAFGLPAMAEDLAHISAASRDAVAAIQRLYGRGQAIEGRGACRHPDGVVRLVRSAFEVFQPDINRHAKGQACAAAATSRYAPVPQLASESDLVWE